MKKNGRRFQDDKDINVIEQNEIVDTDIDDSSLDVDVKSKIEKKTQQLQMTAQEETDNTPVMSKREKQKLIKANKKENEKKAKEKQKISAQLEKKRKKNSAHKQKAEKVVEKNQEGDKTNRLKDFFSNIKTNKKSLTKAAIIVGILVLVVFVYSNSDVLSFNNLKNWVQYGIFNVDSNQQFPCSTDGAVIKNGNFTRIDNNLVYVSDTQFVTMNNWGREIYKTQQTYTNPVLMTAADSDLTLVYNLGGKEFSINNLESTIYKGEAEDNILVADICEDGTYALVTQKYGYMSKLYVYSSENKLIYAYSFADYYITSVALDSSGDSAVLSGLSAHNGKQISAIYQLDFSEEKPQFFKEFNNNAIYYVDHLTDKYCCIIGDKATYTLNLSSETFNTFEYGGKTLTAFTINTDTNTYSLSLSRSGDGHMCDIVSFSTSGNHSGTVSTDSKITAISSYKDRVAALSGDIISLYSKSGSLISQVDAGLDPHSVVMYSKSDAYVLGVSEIRRIDL